MQANGVWSLQPLADMSAAEFRDWQVLLENRTGVVLNEQRRTFLQASLTARMRELGIGDYHSYYRQVTDGPRGAVEWATLLDRLTVQETRFFRHPRLSSCSSATWASACAAKACRGPGPCGRRLLQRRGTLSLAMCAAQVLRGQEREDFSASPGRISAFTPCSGRGRRTIRPASWSNWRPGWSNAIANARPTAASA